LASSAHCHQQYPQCSGDQVISPIFDESAFLFVLQVTHPLRMVFGLGSEEKRPIQNREDRKSISTIVGQRSRFSRAAAFPNLPENRARRVLTAGLWYHCIIRAARPLPWSRPRALPSREAFPILFSCNSSRTVYPINTMVSRLNAGNPHYCDLGIPPANAHSPVCTYLGALCWQALATGTGVGGSAEKTTARVAFLFAIWLRGRIIAEHKDLNCPPKLGHFLGDF
jgi:hypothetical protein